MTSETKLHTIKSLLDIVSNQDIRQDFGKLDEREHLDKVTDKWLDAFRAIQPCENKPQLEMVLIQNDEWFEIDEFHQVHRRKLGDKNAYCQDGWEAYVRSSPDGNNMLFEMSSWNEILSFYVSDSTLKRHGASKICAHAVLGAICLESDEKERQKFVNVITSEAEKTLDELD